MKILTSISAWQNWRNAIPSTQSVGLVPTMGALHAGHQSLITRCRQENDICTISLFVNPTQFNDQNDLTNYPSTFEADQKMCEAEGVDAIFFPDYSELYPDDYRYRVSESEVSRWHFVHCVTMLMAGWRPPILNRDDSARGTAPL